MPENVKDRIRQIKSGLVSVAKELINANNAKIELEESEKAATEPIGSLKAAASPVLAPAASADSLSAGAEPAPTGATQGTDSNSTVANTEIKSSEESETNINRKRKMDAPEGSEQPEESETNINKKLKLDAPEESQPNLNKKFLFLIALNTASRLSVDGACCYARTLAAFISNFKFNLVESFRALKKLEFNLFAIYFSPLLEASINHLRIFWIFFCLIIIFLKFII